MSTPPDVSSTSSSGAVKARPWRYVWLVLCAVLVSIVILAGLMNKNRNRIAAGDAMAAIRTIEFNLIRYKTMAGNLPTEAQGLQAMTEKPTSGPMPKGWHKLTDTSSLIDPWGHPYQYRNPGKKKEPGGFDVYSSGSDGKEGTEDDIYN